jgi:hypothetical protein
VDEWKEDFVHMVHPCTDDTLVAYSYLRMTLLPSTSLSKLCMCVV